MVWKTRLALVIVGYVGLALAIFIPTRTGPADTVSRMLARTVEGYLFIIGWVATMLFLMRGLIPEVRPWVRVFLYATALCAQTMAFLRARGDTLVYHQGFAIATFALGTIALLGIHVHLDAILAILLAVVCGVLMWTTSVFFEYPLIALMIYAVARVDPRGLASHEPLRDDPEKTLDPRFQCMICLEDFNGNPVGTVKLKCGHVYHVDCLEEWESTGSNTCPECKQEIVKVGRPKVDEGGLHLHL